MPSPSPSPSPNGNEQAASSPSPSPSQNGQSSTFTGTTSNAIVDQATSFSALYNHTHEWTIDENGDGVTGPGGDNSHTHQISNFEILDALVTSDYIERDRGLLHSHDSIPRAAAEVSPTQENTDIYGGRLDIDLYNQTPTAYGTLYLLKDFGGELHNNTFDINWMTTDIYSTTTVKAPVDENTGQASPSPSPSPGSTVFSSMRGINEFRIAEMATTDVIDAYINSAHDTELRDLVHPGLIIGATLAYTPGASNTTWEDSGLDEFGVLYGIVNIKDQTSWPAYTEWSEPFNMAAYDAATSDPWTKNQMESSVQHVLKAPYIEYDSMSDNIELPHLAYKFGFGTMGSTTLSYEQIADKFEDLFARTVGELAEKIVSDEIPNQIINRIIDYGDLNPVNNSSIFYDQTTISDESLPLMGEDESILEEEAEDH